MKSSNVIYHQASVTRQRRNKLNDHHSVVLWFTGLSGSGKTTVAKGVERKIISKRM